METRAWSPATRSRFCPRCSRRRRRSRPSLSGVGALARAGPLVLLLPMAQLPTYCLNLRDRRLAAGSNFLRLFAEAVESLSQKLRDLARLAPFDVTAVNHIHRLAVLEQRHRR